MPRSLIPVASSLTCHIARKDCCLPPYPWRRLFFPSGTREVILNDHDNMHFGTQFHGLHPRYIRLHTPRCRNACGFATDLLAGLWSGLTCHARVTRSPTGQHTRVSDSPFIHPLVSGLSWREGKRIWKLGPGEMCGTLRERVYGAHRHHRRGGQRGPEGMRCVLELLLPAYSTTHLTRCGPVRMIGERSLNARRNGCHTLPLG
jgi:hypothetical protein